jgi:hypothetical protein
MHVTIKSIDWTEPSRKPKTASGSIVPLACRQGTLSLTDICVLRLHATVYGAVPALIILVCHLSTTDSTVGLDRCMSSARKVSGVEVGASLVPIQNVFLGLLISDRPITVD